MPRLTLAFVGLLISLLAPAPVFAQQTYTWSNASGGNWSGSGNWSGGTVPLAADSTIFNGLSGAYTVDLTTAQSITNVTVNSANVTFNHTANTLSLGGAFNLGFGTYNLNGGTLAVANTASFTAAAGTTFNWSAGSLGGAGPVTLNGASTASGSNDKFLRSLVTIGNGGSMVVTGTNLRATGDLGAGITINASGLIDLQADGIVLGVSGTGILPYVLTNTGTLRRSVGTGTATITTVVNSTGTIDVQTGTLNLGAGGTVSGSLSGTAQGAGLLHISFGNYSTPAGATFTVSSGLEVSGGGVTTFTAQTGSSIIVNGPLTVSGGSFNTVGSGSITANGSTTVSGGGLGLGSGGGAVTINGSLAWTSGVIGGAGTVTLNGSGTASGGATKVVQGPITIGNGGSLAVTGGSIQSQGSVSGTGIVVNAGGVLDLRADGVVLENFSTGTLSNSGTLRRSTGTGIATVRWNVTNNAGGLIDVQTGTLAILTPFGPTFGTNAGTVQVASGAALQTNVTNNATGVLRGAGTVTGSVNLSSAGATLEAGANVADPNLTITNGLTMALDSRYNVRLFGTGANDISRVDVTGGTTSITTGADLRLDLSGLSAAQVAALANDIGHLNTRSYTVLVATGNITGGGFDAANFSVSNFGNFDSAAWNFGVQTVGSNVVLTFQPVPEPTTVLGLAAAGLGLAGWVRRRMAKAD